MESTPGTVFMLPTTATILQTDSLLENKITGSINSPSVLENFSEFTSIAIVELSKVISIVSIVFNALNIVVLTQREMLSPTSLILTSIALADLFNSCIFFALVLVTPDEKGQILTLPSAIFLAFAINATLTMHSISIWLGVLLSVYRYALLRKIPDTNKRFGTIAVKLSIVFIYIMIPSLLMRNYFSTSLIKNETGYNVDSNLESDMFQFWTYTFGLKVLPCVLMIVFGSCLLYSLRKLHLRRISLHYMHSQNRQNQQRANHTTTDDAGTQSNGNGTNGQQARVEPAIAPRRLRERWKQYSRTTKLLVVIISVFVFTQLPQGIVLVWDIQVYHEYGPLFDIMSLLNNCISFALYCLMSEAFRRMFLRVFCSPFLSYIGDRTRASSSANRSARASPSQPDDRSAIPFLPSFSDVSAFHSPNGSQQPQFGPPHMSVSFSANNGTTSAEIDPDMNSDDDLSKTQRPKPSRPVSVPSMAYNINCSSNSNARNKPRHWNSQPSRSRKLQTPSTTPTDLTLDGSHTTTTSPTTPLPLASTSTATSISASHPQPLTLKKSHRKSNGEKQCKRNEVRFLSQHTKSSAAPMPLVPPAIVIMDEESDKL